MALAGDAEAKKKGSMSGGEHGPETDNNPVCGVESTQRGSFQDENGAASEVRCATSSAFSSDIPRPLREPQITMPLCS
jgi:hypothetical protein